MSTDMQELGFTVEESPTPRTVDIGTWVARGIVVGTIGLLALVGGLVLGLQVADPSTAARPSSSTSASTAPPSPAVVDGEPQAAEESRDPAPPVRVSAAAPDGPDGAVPGPTTAAATVTTVAASTQASPTSNAPSPTSTSTPRGRSGNTGKPKPTKGG